MKAKSDSQQGDASDRQALLDTIRAVVARRPAGKPLSFLKFIAESKLTGRHVFRHFPKWSEALLAAGFNFKHPNAPVSSTESLTDWACVVRELHRLPTANEFKLRGKHGLSTLRSRFGAWSKVPEAFRDFAGSSGEWSDVVALLPPAGKPGKASHARKKQDPPGTPHRKNRRPTRLPGRPVCGPPLDYACLRHAPANEAGVLVLFGAMARDLGFLIDSLQSEFPDCEAKRLIAPDTWQSVRIEFEFQSKNFLTHGHDPAGCDLIVCWEHNWPECPEGIEVIALSEYVSRNEERVP